MFCMSLADLLPWSVFLVLTAVHLAIYLRYFDTEIVNQVPAFVLILAALGIEVLRITYMGRSAVVFAVRDMIIVIALVRLVMQKTSREIYQIVGIAFAECLLSTIFTVSPLFLIGLAMMVFLLPVTLFTLDERDFCSKRIDPDEGIVHWIAVSTGIILTASLLFYMLPRPASSIIRHGLAQRQRVGFTEEVDLKRPGPLVSDKTITMRIVWSSGYAPANFYLSGARLEEAAPDGFSKQESGRPAAPVVDGFTDKITIFPAALSSENVFFPYWLNKVSPRICRVRGSNIYWEGEQPPVYDVWVNRFHAPEHPCSIDLPDELKPVGDLGARVAGEGDAATKARRIAAFLKRTCTYTLDEQRVPPGSSGIYSFVFSGRKGRCEHFASAAAAMLRGCGIPARVVTGFLVSEYNSTGDYFIVRASDAHAWTEYWDGSWYIVDATPSRASVVSKPFHILDDLRFQWNRWVIRYSLDDQIYFASRIIAPSPVISKEIEHMASYAAYLIISGVMFFILFRLFSYRFLPPYEKVRRALERIRITIPANGSHQEHIRMVSEHCPPLEPFFKEYLEHYLAWRFGDQDVDIKMHTKEMIDRIRSMPKA